MNSAYQIESASNDWRRWAMVLCGLTAMILFGYGAVSTRDFHRAREASIAAVAHVAASMLPGGGQADPSQLQGACNRLVDSHAVIGAAILDRSGRTIVGASSFPALIPLIRTEQSPTGASLSLQPFYAPAEDAGRLPDLMIASFALARQAGGNEPAHFCMIIAPSLIVPGSNSSWATFGGLTLASIATVFFWGVRFHHDTVAAPLVGIQQLLHDSRSVDDSICARTDVWGTTARSIKDLQSDLAGWQGQVRRVESSINRQVDEQTKQIARQLKKVERDAGTDALTGLYNRRLLNERLPKIFAAQKAQREDLTVVMFDLDNFKQLNDTLGHAAGDRVIEFAGQLLRECTRRDDLAVRYGGDEFLLLLPGIDAGDAAATAQRIIAMFTQRARMLFPTSTVSMTAGVASLSSAESASPTELIAQADQALYQAKRKGKRTVCTHGQCPAAA